MKPIKKILVPTDFSENAEPAYRHAQEIAHRFGAKIDFIHIVPTLKYFSESIARLEAPLDMIEEELYPRAQKEAKQKLKRVMNEFLAEESKGEAICNIDRKPSDAIARVAKVDSYDLIVMASKGRHGSHLLKGSTTDKVIRHSEIPVFAVDARLSSRGLKRILMPTDGSRISFAALPPALMLAEVWDAEITFYHVQEFYGSPLEYESRNPNKSDEENIYEALLNNLEEFLIDENMEEVQIARGEVNFEDQFIISDGASSRRVDLYTVITKGASAHTSIKEYAEESSDIVVMATHGHGGLAHLFLGSTTEKVARSLDLPVLTVRPGH